MLVKVKALLRCIGLLYIPTVFFSLPAGVNPGGPWGDAPPQAAREETTWDDI